MESFIFIKFTLTLFLFSIIGAMIGVSYNSAFFKKHGASIVGATGFLMMCMLVWSFPPM